MTIGYRRRSDPRKGLPIFLPTSTGTPHPPFEKLEICDYSNEYAAHGTFQQHTTICSITTTTASAGSLSPGARSVYSKGTLGEYKKAYCSDALGRSSVRGTWARPSSAARTWRVSPRSTLLRRIRAAPRRQGSAGYCRCCGGEFERTAQARATAPPRACACRLESMQRPREGRGALNSSYS